MTSLLHPMTYWPPGVNPAAQNLLGRIALKGVAPRASQSGALPSAGSSKAYLKSDVFEIGGLVAAGIFTAIPPTAREIMQVDPRKSRRGKRNLYEATLSDFSGDAFFDEMQIWRGAKQSDGAGGYFEELTLVSTHPCDITFTPAENVVADNEREDGSYTLVALRDSGLQTGDSVYVTTRSVFLKVEGEVDEPKRGLYLTAKLEVADGSYPLDI